MPDYLDDVDDMDDVPFDFSALGPAVPRGQLDVLVRTVMQRNAAELTRRRHGLAVVRVVAAWRRPLLVIAGLAAAAAVVLFTRGNSSSTSTPEQPGDEAATSIAVSLGIPSAFAQSVEGRSASSPEAP